MDANEILDGEIPLADLYDTYICTSFEHLEQDKEILKSLPFGYIIFSVPNFDDPTHFRTFQNEDEIRYRYNNLIDIERIEVIQKDHMKKFIVKAKKY